MTEPENHPDVESPQDVQEPQQDAADRPADEQEDQGDPAAAARREAAAYRRRLRDTEGERDRLAEQVACYQRREVEALAEQGPGHGYERMASGADLWTAGVQLADLLDEDGAVDPAKTQDVVTSVLTERPHWRRNLWGSSDVGQGPRMGSTPSRSFADVLREGAQGHR